MKRIIPLLLALCLLAFAGCKDEPTVAPEPPSAPVETPAAQPAEPPPANESVSEPEPEPETPPPPATERVYEFDGLEIPVPTAFEEPLLVEPEPEAWNEHWTPLISFSSRASVEAYRRDFPDEASASEDGVGWICTVLRLDRVGFEDWLSGDRNGSSVFAMDGGGRFYLLSTPTDVRVYEPDEAWTELNEWAQTLPDTLIARNGLTAYDAGELFEADYTYAGEHVDLGYRFPGEPMDLIVLSLSQPAAQGENGVWCVERVRYVYSEYSFTDTQLVFPVSFGADEPAADYYARLQAECDAGAHPELLTTVGAALDYARRTAWLFGEDVSDGDFELIEAVG